MTEADQKNQEVDFPPGVADMLEVPGLGPKRVEQLWQEFGINDLEALRAAAAEGKLRELPGVGAKTEAKIIEGIDALISRQPVAEAPPVVGEALAATEKSEPKEMTQSQTQKNDTPSAGTPPAEELRLEAVAPPGDDDRSQHSPEIVQEVVRFILEDQPYGVSIHQVINVVRMVAFTVVPEAPPAMLGVINFRGEVIPLIDLRRFFNLPPQNIDLQTPILVVSAGTRKMGLVVDEVLGVNATPVSVQTPSEELSADLRHISFVARLEGQLLMIVDLDQISRAFPNVAVLA